LLLSTKLHQHHHQRDGAIPILVQASAKTGDPGNGLGLAIVNHVVDQHGGKVQDLTRQLDLHHPSDNNEYPGQFAITISIPKHQQK
jgi:signal transduction histidine kinase